MLKSWFTEMIWREKQTIFQARAKLKENFKFCGTDNFLREYFKPNRGYLKYIFEACLQTHDNLRFFPV